MIQPNANTPTFVGDHGSANAHALCSRLNDIAGSKLEQRTVKPIQPCGEATGIDIASSQLDKTMSRKPSTQRVPQAPSSTIPGRLPTPTADDDNYNIATPLQRWPEEQGYICQKSRDLPRSGASFPFPTLDYRQTQAYSAPTQSQLIPYPSLDESSLHLPWQHEQEPRRPVGFVTPLDDRPGSAHPFRQAYPADNGSTTVYPPYDASAGYAARQPQWLGYQLPVCGSMMRVPRSEYNQQPYSTLQDATHFKPILSRAEENTPRISPYATIQPMCQGVTLPRREALFSSEGRVDPQDPARPFPVNMASNPLSHPLPPFQSWPVPPLPHRETGSTAYAQSIVGDYAATTPHIVPIAQGMPAMAPSPDQEDCRGLDQRSFRKQPYFQRRAEIKNPFPLDDRKQSPNHHNIKAPQALLQTINRKRKTPPIQDNIKLPHIALSIQHAHVPGFISPYLQGNHSAAQRTRHAPAPVQAPYAPQSSNIHSLPHRADFVKNPTTVRTLFSLAPVTKPCWDSMHQPITRDYDKYKWSVKIYEIDPNKTGCTCAQSWLESVLFPLLDELYESHKCFAHTSNGFIYKGNQHSFIVLHNASNPFKLGEPPGSTTTIGVYGFYWSEHAIIYWKTFAPGLWHQLDRAEAGGLIREIRKWDSGMKATDKRFHRAYWMCANMMPLGKILNTAKKSSTIEEALEDDNFVVSEEDVGCEWDIKTEIAIEAWSKVLEAPRAVSPGDDHMAVWSSEW